MPSINISKEYYDSIKKLAHLRGLDVDAAADYAFKVARGRLNALAKHDAKVKAERAAGKAAAAPSKPAKPRKVKAATPPKAKPRKPKAPPAAAEESRSETAAAE